MFYCVFDQISAALGSISRALWNPLYFYPFHSVFIFLDLVFSFFFFFFFFFLESVLMVKLKTKRCLIINKSCNLHNLTALYILFSQIQFYFVSNSVFSINFLCSILMV